MAQIIDVSDSTFNFEVMNAQKPVVVDFSAVWCMPCKQISPILEELSESYANKVKIVKINVDENEQITQRYRIMHLPTIMVFKDGQKIDSVTGYRSKAQLAEFIEKHI